jgi:hypothetical protein
MLVFYSSQGMFVIANPAEFWYLFWLPLALLLSQPKRRANGPQQIVTEANVMFAIAARRRAYSSQTCVLRGLSI